MSNRVNITLNNKMLATLDLMAEKVGMNRSEYIRNILMREYYDQLAGDNPVTTDDVYKRMDSYN